MADARDIHIHLTAQPGTTVHVTVTGDDITVASDNADPTASTSDTASSDELEAAIERLGASGSSRNIRRAIDGVRRLGYNLIPAKTSAPGKVPENYLRLMDPDYKTHGIGYITPTYFAFTRGPDRKRLAAMPGAEELTAAVKFSHVESEQPGLAAAKVALELSVSR